MNAAHILVSIAAAGLATNTALAQRRGGAALPPPGGVQAAGVRAAMPTRMPSIGGTRAAFPGKTSIAAPKMSLGGTKAALPRQTSTPNGTFGNQQPNWRNAYKPMPIGPMTSFPSHGGGTGGWNGGGHGSHGPRPTPHGGGGNGNGGHWNGGGNGGGNWHGNGGGNWHGAGLNSGFNGSGFVNNSGVTINGKYTSDNFKLAFHVGSPFSHQHDWCNNFNGYPAFCYPPVYYSYPFWGGWSYYPEVYDSAAYSSYSGYAPAMSPAPAAPAPTYQATPQPVTPSNDRELGDTYMQAGDTQAATKAYRQHLAAHPKDALAMRGLATALIEQSEFRDGAAMMSLAYNTDPSLSTAPLGPGVYSGGAAELRDNVTRVSLYANRVKTPSAWLTLAVLMQAEGRTAVARSAIDKAEAAGLDRAVADRFRSSL